MMSWSKNSLWSKGLVFVLVITCVKCKFRRTWQLCRAGRWGSWLCQRTSHSNIAHLCFLCRPNTHHGIQAFKWILLHVISVLLCQDQICKWNLIITVNVQKFWTLFFFLFSNKLLEFWGVGIYKMLVRIANREDSDQTASSEAVWSGSALLVLTFFAGNYCSEI